MYRKRHLEALCRAIASRCKLETANALREDALNVIFIFLIPDEVSCKKLCSLTQEGSKISYAKLFKEKII